MALHRVSALSIACVDPVWSFSSCSLGPQLFDDDVRQLGAAITEMR